MAKTIEFRTTQRKFDLQPVEPKFDLQPIEPEPNHAGFDLQPVVSSETEKPRQEQSIDIYGDFDVWAAPADSQIWKSPGADFVRGFGQGWIRQTQIPALMGKKLPPPTTTAEKIGEMGGRMMEVITEFIGLGAALRGIGLLSKTVPKSALAVEKALRTGVLFGTQQATEEVRKATAEAIYDEDFGSRGGIAILESFALGTILSLAGSAVGATWNKLKPTEQVRALKTLGLKKGATLHEINKAARIQARRFHPDKVKGMRAKFDKVIDARDALRKANAKDIIIGNAKQNFKKQLMEKVGVSEDVANVAIQRLDAGESITKVDQMLSQAKLGIKPIIDKTMTPTEMRPEKDVTEIDEQAERHLRAIREEGVPTETTETPATVPIPAPTEAVAGRKAEIAPVTPGGKVEAEKLEIKHIPLDAGEGLPIDYLTATSDGKEVGTLRFEEEENEVIIMNIDVDESQRRKGIGTALVSKLKSMFPNKEIKTDLLTDEGQKFFAKALAQPTPKPEAAGVGEKIKAAAYYNPNTGEIGEGITHAQAAADLKGGVAVPEGQKPVQEGFVTESGKFVTNKEAEAIAKKSGQIKKDYELTQEERILGRPTAESILAQPPTEAKEKKDVEKEAITEPAPSPEVGPRKARKFVPTGKLDPTNPQEALEITKYHASWVASSGEKGSTVGGIFETKWDKETKGFVVSSVEYTPEQIDTAYRTIQKPVESPMPDAELFAMPGKESQMKAIAQKMAKVKGVVRPKKFGPKPLTKPTALPKAKTKIEDHIKAVYAAAAKEDTRYAINGVSVEGDTIVATDGRRMFWAKGKWGKDGVYVNPKSLKIGLLGKLKKQDLNFPRWRDIVPDVSDQKPILVPSGGVYEDLDTVFRRVRQAASMTSEESRGITIIENKDGSLGFAAAAPEVGHVEIWVNPGGKILGAVNPQYFLDVIKYHAIRGDRAFELYFSDPTRPILTKSIDGKTFTLTMPVDPGEPSEAVKKAIEQKFLKSRQGGFLALPRTPSPEALREGAEKIYQDAVNRFASIENVTKKAQKLGMEIKPGENPGLQARSYLGLGRKVESVLTDKTYKITPEGNIEITGEGLKPILDDYDVAGKAFEPKRGKRKADAQTYLVSQRIILDLQRPVAEWATKNIVTNAQVQKAKIDLERLKKKYGAEGIKNLENYAQRLYGFEKRVLHTLVDAGNLSQKQYDDIVAKNQHYIPFDRVLGDEIKGGVPVSKGRFTKARAPIRKIKGSEAEVHEHVESIIKNTFRIMEAADRNTVARNVAKLGKALPDDIRPIRIKMFPIKVDPKEILTVSREFRTQSSKVMQEYRDIKTEGGKGADVTGPLKKLEKVVTDALTHRGFSTGEANSFLNQIRKGKAAEVSDVTIETIRQIIRDTQKIIITEEPIESTIFRPSQFAPKGKVIEYFEKGKRKYIEVSPNLYDAMTGLNEEGSSLLVRALSLPAHWLRIGATSTPEFIVRNPIRDQWTALMQTSFGFVPFYDSMGAIADILGKTDVYHDWLRSGGAYSGFVELNRPALKKATKELTSTRSRRLLGRLNIITSAQDLAQLFEQMTRVGIFKKAEKSGLSAIEAGFESREGTLDFQRRGGLGAIRDWNKITAFFNVGVQAADKTVRTAYKNPVATVIKGFASITIPSILLYLHNREDPNYKEIPRWRKDLFWIYMRGDKFPVHIPKPFFYGQMFGSLPERLMEYIDTQDPKAFRDFANTVLESFAPISGEPEGNLLPTALKPIIENWGNRNFFLERPIVPEGKTDIDPQFQYSRYTSESAKHLGRWLNYSPAKIENLIRGYTGGSGRYGLQATDALINAIKKASGQPVPPRKPREAADIPLIKGFVGRSPTGPQAQSIQDFYDDSQKVISAYDTYRRIYGDIIARKQQQDTLMKLRKRRPLSTAEKQGIKPLTPQEELDFAKSEKYKQANPNLLLGPTMKTTRTLLTKLGKQADVIIKMEISDKEKRLRLKKVDSTRLKVSQEANKRLK